MWGDNPFYRRNDVYIRWTFFIISLVPLVGWSQTPSEKNERIEIEDRIQTLKDRLHQFNIKEMHEEVASQGDMIADWEAYSKDIQYIRKLEEEELKIQNEIKQLEQRILPKGTNP